MTRPEEIDNTCFCSHYLKVQVQSSDSHFLHAPLKLPDVARGWLLQVVKLAV